MPKKHYTQLGEKERDQIFFLKKKHFTNSAIADTLSRSKATIGRELRRNIHRKFHQYLPDTAQRKADKRKALCRKTRYTVKDSKLKEKIIRPQKRLPLKSILDSNKERMNATFDRGVADAKEFLKTYKTS